MSNYYHPYQDQGDTRVFSSNVSQDQLVWHRDREDRVVEVVGETDWQFQFDNQLPQPLKTILFIPKGVYHRLIKGNNTLEIKITKL
jgi:hypothetical protein